jgi:glutathione S-transferase
MLKLIGTTMSPYTMRILLAARYKAIELTLEAPAGGAASATFRALNPMGRVPTLIDGELVLPESEVILCYLDDLQPTPPLFAGDAAARANIRLLLRLMDTYAPRSYSPFVRGDDKAAIATALQQVAAALGYIEHFRRDGEFAAGDRFSAADCAFIPVFCVFESLQRRYGTLDLLEQQPKLERWWNRARDTELGAYARATMGAAFRALRS